MALIGSQLLSVCDPPPSGHDILDMSVEHFTLGVDSMSRLTSRLHPYSDCKIISSEEAFRVDTLLSKQYDYSKLSHYAIMIKMLIDSLSNIWKFI